MRNLAVLILALPILLMTGAAPAFAFPEQSETFSGSPKLEVMVVTSTGLKLAGATVKLCRTSLPKAVGGTEPAAAGPAAADRCRLGATNEQGKMVFDQLAPDEYRLKVRLAGFIATTVGPLSINAGDPIAPDRVVLVLNAACYDCLAPTPDR